MPNNLTKNRNSRVVVLLRITRPPLTPRPSKKTSTTPVAMKKKKNSRTALSRRLVAKRAAKTEKTETTKTTKTTNNKEAKDAAAKTKAKNRRDAPLARKRDAPAAAAADKPRKKLLI